MSGVHFGAMVPKVQTSQYQNKSKKDPVEGVTFSSQLACSVSSCNEASTSLEVLIQLQLVMLVTAQTPPCSAKR